MRVPTKISVIRDEVLAEPPYVIALKLSAIFFLIRGFLGGIDELHNILVACLCALVLINRKVLASGLVWMVMFVTMAIVICVDWPLPCNHKYLAAYWTLGCALALGTADVQGNLARCAQWILGLAFGFAVLWKFLPGEFVDGSFFHSLYLTDGRFRAAAMALAPLDAAAIEENDAIMTGLKLLVGDNASVVLRSTERLQVFALLTSYWVIFIEGSVAISFLLFRVRWLGRWRDLFLLTFICTTYSAAPIDRFTSILSIMGYAQCEPHRRTTRTCYLIVFLLMQFSRLQPVVNELVVDWLS